MFDNYRVVCVTPAGRRRYLKVLVPQVLASPLVDEYHLWMNTTDLADIEYLYQLREIDSRVRLIEPGSLPAGVTQSIRQFFRGCIDRETLYVRFDDDVVFIEPGFFETFLELRVRHPRFFLVFPNTINNALCTYALVQSGIVKPGARVHPWCMDVNAWGNPRFAEQLHRAFLSSVMAGRTSSWYFGPKLIAFARYSVNCMAWCGSEFAQFGGAVPEEEEEYLSVTKPTALMLPNCICGDAIVAHYAFMPQRPYLDSTDILHLYAEVASHAAPRSDAAA